MVEMTNDDCVAMGIRPLHLSPYQGSGQLRRSQARDQMSSSLRERSTIKWNWSRGSDLSYSAQQMSSRSARTNERKFEVAPRHQPSSSSYNPFRGSSSRNKSLQICSRTTSRAGSNRRDSCKTHKVTLGELRKFFDPDSKDRQHREGELGNGVTLNIESAIESYPNISVTIKTEPKRVVMKRFKNRPIPEDRVMQPTVLPAIGPDRHEAKPVIMDPKMLGEADSQEWTRRWVWNNPLGPSKSPEIHINSSLISDERSQSVAGSQKRVHFGLD